MAWPVTQYVLKVHSLCDLSCDHCYVYEHADQTWRAKPRVPAEATVLTAAGRIAEHAAAHRLDAVHVVLHGGEPLLLGRDRLRDVLTGLRSLIDPVTRLHLRIHTNGVRLDEQMCELFAEHEVRIGVSLDGDRSAHDRHRRFADGRGSHARVRQALALLRQPRYQQLYAGILCTVDLRNDPIEVYEALLAEAPPRFDLLLPHATWEQPPYRPAGVPAPYADWLGQIYARWTADGRPVPIRLFDSLRSASRGGPSWSEAVGLDPVDLLVIETDGSWEQTDSLKTAYHGAATTGLNVFSHSVDEAAAHPGLAARRGGLAALCSTCRACPAVRACGGGMYAHRYSASNGFDNPSVYCRDLKALVSRVAARPDAAAMAPSPSARRHALPPGAFDSLSAGPGDSAAIAALAETRLSVTRALVAAVASGLSGRRGALSRVAAEGWALLSGLDAERPEAVREILLHPYTQAWAVRCLRPPDDADPDLDRAHMAGLAAAAALRAGLAAELPVPVRKGSIYLPTFGVLRVGPRAGRSCLARFSPRGIVTGNPGSTWLTVRRATGAGLSVAVEDVDPFRDCQAWPVARRLSPRAWRTWKLALARAAEHLAFELPAYSAPLFAGLRSVVPLRPDPAGHRRSSTAREAFGAVAVALPSDSDTLIALLVHEFQHVKLSALTDLFDLFDPGDGRLLQVPWRADLRPVEGVLHGTYAHLGIAELWRSRASGAADGKARDLFQRYRSWVKEAIDTLSGSGALTTYGERFVSGMNAAVEAWAVAG